MSVIMLKIRIQYIGQVVSAWRIKHKLKLLFIILVEIIANVYEETISNDPRITVLGIQVISRA